MDDQTINDSNKYHKAFEYDEELQSNFPNTIIFVIAKVLHNNAYKFPPAVWRKVSIAEHIQHAQKHIQAYFDGDVSEPHLYHALTRLAFASELLYEYNDFALYSR
jgi:hypothetical protein